MDSKWILFILFYIFLNAKIVVVVFICYLIKVITEHVASISKYTLSLHPYFLSRWEIGTLL